MTTFRSIVLVAWLALSAIFVALVWGPFALFSEGAAIAGSRAWARAGLAAAKRICGLDIEIRGREHVPQGAAIVAAKHQAMIDTIAPFAVIDRPALVLKRELLKVPIYGWFAEKAGMIAVDREAHASALKAMLRAARKSAADNRALVIYPEGTRSTPGAPPDYKPGVAALYRDLKLPCVPVALNTGLFWSAKGFSVKPGVAVIEFLPPIAPGLPREDFMAALETAIETASNKLLEARR